MKKQTNAPKKDPLRGTVAVPDDITLLYLTHSDNVHCYTTITALEQPKKHEKELKC